MKTPSIPSIGHQIEYCQASGVTNTTGKYLKKADGTSFDTGYYFVILKSGGASSIYAIQNVNGTWTVGDAIFQIMSGNTPLPRTPILSATANGVEIKLYSDTTARNVFYTVIPIGPYN